MTSEMNPRWSLMSRLMIPATIPRRMTSIRPPTILRPGLARFPGTAIAPPPPGGTIGGPPPEGRGGGGGLGFIPVTYSAPHQSEKDPYSSMHTLVTHPAMPRGDMADRASASHAFQPRLQRR